jgi:lipid-A-disaccharide synthase-like uncharacterized protein
MGNAAALTVVLLICVGAFLFWATMLIQAIQNEHEYDKIAWVIVILFTNIFGALIYLFYQLFLRRKP